MSDHKVKKRKRIDNKAKSDEPALKRQRQNNSNNKTQDNDKDNDKNNTLILNELLRQRSQIKHLDYKHKILLLGEGDFSFAASLSRLGFCNLVATSYQDYNSIIKKHYNTKYNIQLIKRMKNTIFHNIDINKLNQHKHFKSLTTEQSKFDRIIFNFPHTGLSNYEYQKSIPSNQALLCSIFEQSSNLLKNNGELHITLKSEPIYNSWDIQKQCKSVQNSLALKKRINFEPEIYFGYQHKTTINNQNVGSHSSFIWIFGKYIDGATKDWKPIVLNPGIKFSVGMYKCKTCHQSYNSQKRYEMHMNSKKHNETKQMIASKKKNNKKKKKKKTTITPSGKKRF